MKKTMLILWVLVNTVYAGNPVWTFTPLTATSASMSENDTAVIGYTVTNKSRKKHTLAMNAIQGITQDTGAIFCKSPFTLAYQESCTLRLNVTGSQLTENVNGGPVVCNQEAQGLQCYQPSSSNRLNITKVLYSNGPLINKPGQGAGGKNASMVQTNLGMTSYGWNDFLSNNFFLADDFIVPSGQAWNVKTLSFFLYQTNSGLISTIKNLRFVIYDAPLTNPNKNIVCGTMLDNAKIKSNEWSQIYRVYPDTFLSNTQRPIMQVTVDSGGCILNQGTYWLAWTSTGDNLLTGPWAPVITINGQTSTGNALQSTNSGVTWNPLIDVGPQGLPFTLRGTIL